MACETKIDIQDAGPIPADRPKGDPMFAVAFSAYVAAVVAAGVAVRRSLPADLRQAWDRCQ